MQKRSKETEKRILNTALELFIRKGYHGTTIDDIMRNVGLTKGALYSHFDSKGNLLIRILKEFEIQFIDEMIKRVTEFDGDALAKLHYNVSFNSRFALENENLCVFLTFLATELNEDVNFKPLLLKLYSKYQKFISHFVQTGITQGLFKKELDPDIAALIFMALHDGVLHQWALNRDKINGEIYVKTFRNIFFNGLSNQNVTSVK